MYLLPVLYTFHDMQIRYNTFRILIRSIPPVTNDIRISSNSLRAQTLPIHIGASKRKFELTVADIQRMGGFFVGEGRTPLEAGLRQYQLFA